jgi:hypothetical protein
MSIETMGTMRRPLNVNAPGFRRLPVLRSRSYNLRGKVMRSYPAFVIAVAALMAQVAAAQQGPPLGERVRGTVKSVAADRVVLTTPKGEVSLAITPQTRVTAQQPASASDIKPGAYLGTANQNGSAPDTGTATEVHLADNGGNVNRPMNDSGLTMTNGHVKNVTRTAAGQEMDIDYGEGKTRRVVVKSGTPVTRMAEAGMAGLKAGSSVTALTMTASDGKAIASMIIVGVGETPARP